MNKLIFAINFAANAHCNQRRKDATKTPYINHPIEVMYLLSNAGITDVDILSAAVLHDTMEDTNTSYDDIYQNFGKNVADIVKDCTDNKSLPKEVRKQEQVKHSKEISGASRLVKLADKLSNLSSLLKDPPVGWTQKGIDGYFCWAYAVCSNMMGHNSYLDDHLQKIFIGKGLWNIDHNELEKKLEEYYRYIKYT